MIKDVQLLPIFDLKQKYIPLTPFFFFRNKLNFITYLRSSPGIHPLPPTLISSPATYPFATLVSPDSPAKPQLWKPDLTPTSHSGFCRLFGVHTVSTCGCSSSFMLTHKCFFRMIGRHRNVFGSSISENFVNVLK